MLQVAILSMGWILEYLAISYWAMVFTPMIACRIEERWFEKNGAREFADILKQKHRLLLASLVDAFTISDVLEGPVMILFLYRYTTECIERGWVRYLHSEETEASTDDAR